MAGFEIDGLDQFQLDLKSIMELPDSTIEQMLNAGANVLKPAVKSSAQSMGVYDSNQRYPSTHVADAVSQTKVYHNSDGGATYITFRGNKHRANTTTREAEVAFINEYGKAGQPARQFMRTAGEANGEKINSAMEKVYDSFLKSKNL